MYQVFVFCLVLVLTTRIEGKFPISPKPCSYGDEECIKKMIDFLLTKKSNGYAPLNVISVNPLKILEININQGKQSPVNINLKFQNSELTGINKGQTLSVKGFGKKIDQMHEIILGTDRVSLLSDYSISGKVLILPISGTGKSNITMENVRMKVSILGESITKDGETYMNIKVLKLDINTTRMHFDFENLFNGDKILGDNMNLFLNENWKEIYGEVRESITSAFASIFQSVITNVFSKYPYKKLFASE